MYIFTEFRFSWFALLFQVAAAAANKTQFLSMVADDMIDDTYEAVDQIKVCYQITQQISYSLPDEVLVFEMRLRSIQFSILRIFVIHFLKNCI